jgi:hypothetical protein
MNMRVPICPKDLVAGSGFTRLAKRLKRDWPGTEPLRLSEAQEILARCLGYASYHEVVQLAQEPQGNIDFPPLQSVMVDCLNTVWHELFKGGRCKTFNLGELQKNIYNWPFLLLSVYRKHYGHADNYIVGRAIRTDHIETFLRTQTLSPEYISKVIQEKLGHEITMSTSAYISTPMGNCTNSFFNINLALAEHKSTPCIDSNASISRVNPREILDGKAATDEVSTE